MSIQNTKILFALSKIPQSRCKNSWIILTDAANSETGRASSGRTSSDVWAICRTVACSVDTGWRIADAVLWFVLIKSFAIKSKVVLAICYIVIHLTKRSNFCEKNKLQNLESDDCEEWKNWKMKTETFKVTFLPFYRFAFDLSYSVFFYSTFSHSSSTSFSLILLT